MRIKHTLKILVLHIEILIILNHNYPINSIG